MGYGMRIKEILHERHMTIRHLAEIAGVSYNTLYAITKRDSTRIDPVIKKKIERALGVLPDNGMSFADYQTAAARTIRKDMLDWEIESHALHGMVAEIGELHGLYQKVYQGHAADKVHLMKELGDLLWFVAEYCTAHGWDMGEVAQMNIDKLLARYPEGFDADKSLHRKEGDI